LLSIPVFTSFTWDCVRIDSGPVVSGANPNYDPRMCHQDGYSAKGS
jgi:hypothetical protein